VASVQDNCPLTYQPPTYTETVLNGSCADDQTHIRAYTHTDLCGASATATRVITYQDIIAPSLTVPPDVTFQCGSSYSTSISSTGNGVATDNCDPNPIVSYTDQTTPSSCFSGTGVITRTFTATDRCDNMATGIPQHINIIDTTPPSITVTNQCLFPPNGVVYCYSRSDLVAGFSDTCSTVTVADGTSSSPGFSYDAAQDQYCVAAVRGLNVGVSFTATDNCGNQATATADITAPDYNSNCAVFTSCDSTITGVSSSTAVFTSIDAYGYEYAPQYEASVTIQVQEVSLSNWRLEIHFPDGDELVRYSQYEVYTDGQFQCETSTRSTAVVSPQPWANPVAQGGAIVVQFVATNNGGLSATQIEAVTQLYVFTAN